MSDEYYSIQGAASDVGGITATGFIVTNGFGTSGYAPGTEKYNPLIIGEDIVISYHSAAGSSSWTMCNGLSFCTPSEADGFISNNVIATAKGLYCGVNCYMDNTLQLFVSYGGGMDEYGTFLNNQNIIETKNVNPNLSITGPASSTMPSVPELDPGQLCIALLILTGVALVSRGRR